MDSNEIDRGAVRAIYLTASERGAPGTGVKIAVSSNSQLHFATALHRMPVEGIVDPK